MSESAERLKSDLARLSVEDRAELAHFLLHSLDEGEDSDGEAAWDAELARREQEIRSGIDKGEPIDLVLPELRNKYK